MIHNTPENALLVGSIALICLPLCLISGIVSALVARNKGEGIITAFLIGIILGPIGLLIVILTSGSKCPYCKSRIHTEATTCPKCCKSIYPGQKVMNKLY